MATPQSSGHSNGGWFGLLPGPLTSKHLWALALVAVATPVAAVIAHKLMPPSYVSESKILVKLGREFLGPAAQSGRSASMYRLNEAINSEIEILDSRELAQSVVELIGVEDLYPSLASDDSHSANVKKQLAAASLNKDLSSSGVAESSVIRVAFAHKDPVIAQRVLEAIMSQFQARHLAVFSGPRLAAADDSVETAQEALRAAEDARTKYREENQIFDTQEERAILLRRRAELRNLLEQARSERGQLEENPESGEFRSELDRQEATEIARLRAEERRLLENYLPKSKVVRLVRAQITSRESIALERRYGRIDTLKAEEARLESVLTSVQTDLGQVEAKERALRELDRAVSLQEARLMDAQAARQSASMESKLDADKVTSIVIIDNPSLPLEASGVGLTTKVAAGGMAGLFLGGSLVLLMQLLERGRREEDELALGVPAGEASLTAVDTVSDLPKLESFKKPQ